MKKKNRKVGKKQIVLIVAGIVFGVLAVIYLAFAFLFHNHFCSIQRSTARTVPVRPFLTWKDKIRNGIDGYTLSKRGTGWKRQRR